MDFDHPVAIYTAANNIEAHLVVDLLQSHGINAYAVEDQSGVSLYAFGTLQFHQPQVWIDELDQQQAAELIADYEEKNKARNEVESKSQDILVVCEECGKTTTFAASLDGTTQECSHCRAYVDVGDLPWEEEDYGQPED